MQNKNNVFTLLHACFFFQLLKEDDALWPQPDRIGRQVSFCCNFYFAQFIKINSSRLNCLGICPNKFCQFKIMMRFKFLFLFLKELEIVMGDEHISFTTSKIGSLIDVNNCK